MFIALVSAETSTTSGLSFANVLVLIALVAVGWPLLRKLRRSASESRKRRWVEEGLMDPPTTDPKTTGPKTDETPDQREVS